MFRARGNCNQESGGFPGGPARPDVPQANPWLAKLKPAARKVRHRNRKQIIPWIALPLLPASALAAHALHGEPVIDGVAIVTAAGVPLLKRERARRAAAVAKKDDAEWKRRCRTAWAWRTPAGAAATTGWMAWVGTAGWSPLAGETFAAASTVTLLVWWNRYRLRHGHAKPEVTPQASPTPEPAPPNVLLARLRDRVCGPGGTLAGAQVTELDSIKGGRVFGLDLVPGKQNSAHVLAAKLSIASAAEVSPSRVIPEAWPGENEGETGPANKARVTILAVQHLHSEIQEFTEPTLERSTGLFVVGPYPDAEPAYSRLYKVDENGRPFRACSGLTAGAMGSGKSRYAEHQIMEQLASGLFKVFLLDGQGGASIPDLLDYVDWPALRAEEWEICIRAAVRLMVVRTRRQAARRIPCWYATPEDPFVHIQVEEAHKPLMNPICLRGLKALTQEGEKVGIGTNPSTQFPSQVELGGQSGTTGANALRDLVTSGNVTLFRTGSNFAKSVMVGSVEVSPRDLPKLPGMCHPLGVSMRTAPVRAIRAVQPSAWAHLFRETQFSDLDVAALDGDDGIYSSRMERIRAHMTEPDAQTLDVRSVAEEVAIMLGEPVPGNPAMSAGGGDGRVPAATVILTLLRERGPMTRADAHAAVKEAGHDFHPSALDQAYAALKRHGGVRDDSAHGVWEATKPALSIVRTAEG